MDTLTCQRPTSLSTLPTTMRRRAARIPGLRAVTPSQATCSAQGGVRTRITDYDLAPSPAIIAVGLVLMMATAVAAACSAAYTPHTEMGGINAHAGSEYADGVQHRRLRRVR
jgi:hypothetical protein